MCQNISMRELERAVNTIFLRYDRNFDGHIDSEQMKELLGDVFQTLGRITLPTSIQSKRFIKAIDKNGDGKISRQQLLECFKTLFGKK